MPVGHKDNGGVPVTVAIALEGRLTGELLSLLGIALAINLHRRGKLGRPSQVNARTGFRLTISIEFLVCATLTFMSCRGNRSLSCKAARSASTKHRYLEFSRPSIRRT